MRSILKSYDRLDYGPEDFRFIQAMMLEHAGISLNEGKQELVYSRLAKRVRVLGLPSFRDYCNKLNQDKSEILHLINSMTTNVTSFFRERHHFEFLTTTLLPTLSSVRIWSAGCSSGEEPYSIAFTCHDHVAKHPKFRADILATDLDSDVLDRARQGIYLHKDIADLRESDARRWFLRGKGSQLGRYRVMPSLQKLIEFRQLNLKDDFHHPHLFDVVFCRNVMIYFDHDLRTQLLARFHRSLKPGGYLILGHSESLFGTSSGFRVVGKTIHQRIGD